MVDLSLHILDVATNAFKAKATLVKIIIEEKDGKVTTVDIGLTSMKKLKKIENEILSHINEN